jgi:hypothetical protein
LLRHACADDKPLESDIRSLLTSDQHAGSFVEKPAIEMAAQALGSEQMGDAHESIGGRAETAARPMPVKIGRYRIGRLLGEGGMGMVYEAVQEHPHRTVALKVVKPGLDSSLLRRFEHESQALARVQHPGIAQIYEAGTADIGFGPQPYFAMEFIRGRALREYVETHRLGMRERLELMVKICRAVETLAGRRPYQVSSRLHEAVRTIREEDPAPLSSIDRMLRGDVEIIVAKALEKDKARRYGSAAALAEDIERYLTDEPIRARAPSAPYQLRKFAQRHKALVASVATVFVVVVCGIVASTWEAVRANRAQQT